MTGFRVLCVVSDWIHTPALENRPHYVPFSEDEMGSLGQRRACESLPLKLQVASTVQEALEFSKPN